MSIEEAVVEVERPQRSRRPARERDGADPRGAALKGQGMDGASPWRGRRLATSPRPCGRDDAELLAMMGTLVNRALSLLPPDSVGFDAATGARVHALRTEELFATLQAIKEGRIPLRP